MLSKTVRCAVAGVVRFCILLVAFASASGCASITFDLSDIDEPVMLNPLPYAESEWKTKRVAGYVCEVSHATGAASTGAYTSRTGEVFENAAQVKAFNAIGGHADRAITVDSIEAWGGGANLLFAFVEMSAVKVRGKVVRIGTGGRAKR